MGKLDGKVVLITGAVRGMGAEYARAFAAEGAKVMFSDILVREGEALVADLGSSAKFVRLDVTSEEDWKNAIAEAERSFGRVQILINHAGVDFYRPFESMTLAEYMRVINVNLVGVFLGMKYILPSMKAAGGGSIVNISSISGLKGRPYGAAYSSSKYGVRGLTQSAALEFAPFGIRVNSVHLGAVENPMQVQKETRDSVREFAKTIPLQRLAVPQELINMVLFLASDDSSYCTAGEFVVDGGSTAM